MDKIKCPHCGAINQDVTEQDTCWNCGKPLSASAAVIPAATDAANASEPAIEAGGQRLKAQPSLEERVAARKEERLANRRVNPAVSAIIVMLILLIAIILYFVVFRHA